MSVLVAAVVVVGGVLSAGPPASASGSGASGSSGAAQGWGGAALQRGTAAVARSNSDASFTSVNWAGYLDYLSSEETDFNGVTATWVEPTVTCTRNSAWTIFWAGLDGWWDDTVEQGGSEARCGLAGAPPTYDLWWEMYPTNAIQTVLAVHAGDTIKSTVTFNVASSDFTIYVQDLSAGTGFSKVEPCGAGLTCSRSSADVTAEDVGSFPAGSFYPLADYGTIGFTKAGSENTAGHQASLSSTQWLTASVTEVSSGTTLATVSPLSASGNNFSATWQAAS